MEEKQKLRNVKGITLIALVVTIIVLIILAGVSISLVLGENGIITKSKYAKQETLNAQVAEQEQLNEAESYLENMGGTNPPKQDDNSSETIAGKTYRNETNIVVGETSVTVPGGATISGIPGEYENVDKGLVIYIIPENEPQIKDWEEDSDKNGIIDVQEKYDQFVWVPVPNAVLDLTANPEDVSSTENIKALVQKEIDEKRYPMAIAKEKVVDENENTKTNYIGILYQFSIDTTNTEDTIIKVETYKTIIDSWNPLSNTSGLGEPRFLEDTTQADGSDWNNDVNPKLTQDLLQNEFNTMIEKVVKNKGFWIGRYETTNMSKSIADDSSQQVSVIKGNTTGISSLTWYRMYAQQKNYSNLVNISATSSMIWGSQWDQIMLWLKDVKNESQDSKYIVNSIGMGNYGEISDVDDGYNKTFPSDPAATGYNDKHKVRNIYDLAGNVEETTMTGAGKTNRINRRRRL